MPTAVFNLLAELLPNDVARSEMFPQVYPFVIGSVSGCVTLSTRGYTPVISVLHTAGRNDTTPIYSFRNSGLTTTFP